MKQHTITSKPRRLITALIAAGVLSLGTAGGALAWGGMGMGGMGPGGGQGPGNCAGGGGQMMQVFNRLDLTDAQRDAIRDIQTDHRDQMRTTRDQIRDVRQTMHEQVTSDSYDPAKVRELADNKAKLMSDMMVQRAETLHRIHQQLTPEQQAELDTFRGRGFGPMGY